MVRKEMTPVGDDFHPGVFLHTRGKLLDDRPEFVWGAELVEFAGRQKLRFLAVIKIGESTAPHIADGQAQANELRNARVGTTDTQANP